MTLSTWSNEDAASLGTLDRLVAIRRSIDDGSSIGTPKAPNATTWAVVAVASLGRDGDGVGVGGRSVEARSAGDTTRAQSSGIDEATRTEDSSVLSGISVGTTATNNALFSVRGILPHITNKQVLPSSHRVKLHITYGFF